LGVAVVVPTLLEHEVCVEEVEALNPLLEVTVTVEVPLQPVASVMVTE
jgi:hypothetical protein